MIAQSFFRWVFTGSVVACIVGSASGAYADLYPALYELVKSGSEGESPALSEADIDYLDGLSDHALRLLEGAIEGERIFDAGHLAAVLGLRLSMEKIEFVLNDNCILCHSNGEFHDDPTLLRSRTDSERSHMDLKDAIDDVHLRKGLSCAGCHGGDPTGFMAHDHPDEWPVEADARRASRDWVPYFCARCHEDAGFMREFAPALPTDQLAKYRQSRHGRLVLGEIDARAAECTSCHGVHGIKTASNPKSRVFAKNVPGTCGACHSDASLMEDYVGKDGGPFPTDQEEKYRNSVHGIALFEKGDLGVATCNDCHGNHAATPPKVANVSQVCRECHANKGALFDGSRHKELFEQYGWPECTTCHENHDIQETNDAMLGTGPESMCVDCHQAFAAGNPVCETTREHFHQTLLTFRHSLDEYHELTTAFAERGIDVEGMQNTTDELSDAVMTSRASIHAFDMSDFDAVARRGYEATERLRSLVEEAKKELESRRRGILVAIGLTWLLALAIYVRLRAHERDRDRS